MVVISISKAANFQKKNLPNFFAAKTDERLIQKKQFLLSLLLTPERCRPREAAHIVISASARNADVPISRFNPFSFLFRPLPGSQVAVPGATPRASAVPLP